MTWRPSATAASASTFAISWIPCPPMPVKITSRSSAAVETAVIVARRLLGGERGVEQPIERLRASVAHHHGVADRFPAATLHAGGHRDLAEQRLGFVAMIGFRVGVHFEVLHIEAVVLLQPLVHDLGIPRLRRQALA